MNAKRTIWTLAGVMVAGAVYEGVSRPNVDPLRKLGAITATTAGLLVMTETGDAGERLAGALAWLIAIGFTYSFVAPN